MQFPASKTYSYCIGVPYEGTYAEVFNSEAKEFGGCGITNGTNIKSEETPMHGYEQSVCLTLPPMSVIFLKCVRKKSKRVKDPKEQSSKSGKTVKK